MSYNTGDIPRNNIMQEASSPIQMQLCQAQSSFLSISSQDLTSSILICHIIALKIIINISFTFWLRVIITKSVEKNLWLWSECLQIYVCTYIFRFVKKSTLSWVIYIHYTCYYYSHFYSYVLNLANETNQLLKLKLWESSLTPPLPHPLYFINIQEVL